MREVKFRVWDKYLGIFLKEDFGVNKRGSLMLYDYHGSEERSYSEIYNQDSYAVQQFTGLKDKNGKEIYEGDIVREPIVSDLFEQEKLSIITRVGWSETEQGWRTFAYPEGKYKVSSGSKIKEGSEVIGNIFENPDLIK